MLWLYIAAAAAGALLGLLWLRVLAVLAGSLVFVAITIGLTTIERWSLLEAVVNVLMLLATLQFSYLVMLVLSSAWSRVPSRGPFNASSRRM
jgi:hypothetical protein